MARHVGQRFLHDAVDRDRGCTAQHRRVGIELQVDLDAQPLPRGRGQRLDGAVEPQVVEHWRAQVAGQLAHRIDGLVEHLAQVFEAAGEIGAVPGSTRHLGQHQLGRAQPLAEFIVQFARNALAFGLQRVKLQARHAASFKGAPFGPCRRQRSGVSRIGWQQGAAGVGPARLQHVEIP